MDSDSLADVLVSNFGAFTRFSDERLAMDLEPTKKLSVVRLKRLVSGCNLHDYMWDSRNKYLPDISSSQEFPDVDNQSASRKFEKLQSSSCSS